MCLTVGRYKQVAGCTTMIDKTWYNRSMQQWEDAYDLDESGFMVQDKKGGYFITRDRKVNYSVTHYNPLSEIPMPE